MLPHRMSFYLTRACELDSLMCIRVNRTSRYFWVRRLFRIVSRLGDGMFWYAVMLGILAIDGENGLLPCLHMALAGLGATAVYKAVKGRTLRPRPYEVHQDIALAGIPLDRFSFPSGHTLHAVAFSMVGLFYYPALAWLLLPFTMLVAMSRIVLGLHYPSDVLAGALIGTAIGQLALLP